MNKSEKIAALQNEIDVYKKIWIHINESNSEDIRIKIETKHWHGYSEPLQYKLKDKIILSKEQGQDLMSSFIAQNKLEINKLLKES